MEGAAQDAADPRAASLSQAAASCEPGLVDAVTDAEGSAGQLSAVSGQLSAALSASGAGLSSRQHSGMQSRSDFGRSMSLYPPRSPLSGGGGGWAGAEAELGAAEQEAGADGEAEAAAGAADLEGVAPDATGCVQAEPTGAAAEQAGDVPDATAAANAPVLASAGAAAELAEPAPTSPAQQVDAAGLEQDSAAVADAGRELAVEPAPTSPQSASSAAPSRGPSSPSSSTSAASPKSCSTDAEQPASSPPLAAVPSRLSVRQLLEARAQQKERAAAVPAGGAEKAESAGGVCSSPGRSRAAAGPPGSRFQSRLASCKSSPLLSSPSARRQPHSARHAAAGGSPPGSARAESSSGGGSVGSSSRLGLAGSHMPSLLRPTASYMAGIEAVESRRQLLAQKSMPSTYKPKSTELRPFHLESDIRAKDALLGESQVAHLTSEERKALEAVGGREHLARELKHARERCCRSLTATPLRDHTQHDIPPPAFKPFKLASLARHEAYTQQFSLKVAEQQRQEDAALHTPRSGSRSPSRIGALHGIAQGGPGSAPPALATEERAARHAQRSAERRHREEAETAQKEAERVAQLTAEERAEEEERRQHRFKARKMPAFGTVFVPDKSKAKPATVPREFTFSARFGAHESPAASAAEKEKNSPGRAEAAQPVAFGSGSSRGAAWMGH
ncbi:hypothetical protein ABPG75_000874 [Micractinium tetrahymenae]